MISALKGFAHTTIYTPLYNLLIFFAWLTPGHSIGWAIILLTIFIRLILLPSSLKAARSQVKLQALQPKVNELRKSIKDPNEQGRAIMALYKESGTSPFASCLPQLVQLPLLYILYRVFQNGLDTSRFPLLYSFTPRPETINTEFFGLNLAQPELWLLPILAGLAQLVLSRMMAPPKGAATAADPSDPAQMMQKQMVFIFPLMSFFFARMFPAALALYWVSTTLFMIAQQWYVNRNIKVESRQGKVDGRQADKEKGLSAVSERIPLRQNSAGQVVPGKTPKKDLMSRVVEGRLKKQEKKGDVSVTVRKKEKK